LKDIYDVDSKVLYPILDKEFTNHTIKNIDITSKTIFTYGRWVK